MKFSEEVDTIFKISRFNPLFDYLEEDIVNKSSLLRNNADYTDEELDCLLSKINDLHERQIYWDNLPLLKSLVMNNSYLLNIKIENLLDSRKILQDFYIDYRIYRNKSNDDLLDKIISKIGEAYKNKSEDFWDFYYLLMTYLKFHNVSEIKNIEKYMNYIMTTINYSLFLQNEEFSKIISNPMTYFGKHILQCDNANKISLNIIYKSLEQKNPETMIIRELDSFYDIENNPITCNYVNDLSSMIETKNNFLNLNSDIFVVFSIYNKLKHFNMLEYFGIIDDAILKRAYTYVCDYFVNVSDMDLYMYIHNYTTCRLLSMKTRGIDVDICNKFINDTLNLLERFDLKKYYGGDIID